MRLKSRNQSALFDETIVKSNLSATNDLTTTSSPTPKLKPFKRQNVAFAVWLIVLSTQSIWVCIFTGVMVIAMGTLATKRIETIGFKISAPILILTTIGAITGLFNANASTWDYVRDFVYLGKMPVYIIASIILLKKNTKPADLAISILIAGVFLSALYLFQFIDSGAVNMTRRQLRTTVGRGYTATIFAVISAIYLYLSSRRSQQNLFLCVVAISFLITPVLLSTSRTLPSMMVYFLIAFLIAARGYNFQKIATALVVACMLLTIPEILAAAASTLTNIFGASVMEGFSELTASDFGTYEQINASFRGYEALMAWQQFQISDSLAQVFGHGFGERINLGVSIRLGLSAENLANYQSVPVTHISGLTALLKFGWLGFIIYFATVLWLTVPAKTSRLSFFKVMNYGTILVLLHTIMTFQGLFAMLDVLNVSIAIAASTLYLETKSQWARA